MSSRHHQEKRRGERWWFKVITCVSTISVHSSSLPEVCVDLEELPKKSQPSHTHIGHAPNLRSIRARARAWQLVCASVCVCWSLAASSRSTNLRVRRSSRFLALLCAKKRGTRVCVYAVGHVPSGSCVISKHSSEPCCRGDGGKVLHTR